MTKHLIIIPGLGDMHWVFRIAAPLFALQGFRVHISLVGWSNTEEAYPEKVEALTDLIDSLDGDISILGVSAGGIMAVIGLAARENMIGKVVTLCSPYVYRFDHEGELLGGALKDQAGLLPTLHGRYTDVTSFHGMYDPVVRVAYSRYPDIRSRLLPMILHGPTIFLGLTFLSPLLGRYLSNKKT
jgi:pimeloyl-ACP methyl ester carboxylesterase